MQAEKRLEENFSTLEGVPCPGRPLASTNDLLTRSAEQTAGLPDILMAEMKPYGEGRIAIQGEAVALPPQLARALALVFHELATNAAKYGALSRPEGRLLIRWAIRAGRVQIDWAESGGPSVAPVRERGFGTHLLEYVLDRYQGKVEIDFRPDGVVCEIAFPLPGAEPRQTVARPPARLQTSAQPENGHSS